MASVIKLKRNSSAGVTPSGGDLQAGELAINLADKKLFSSTDGSDVIQISGDAYEVNAVANTTAGSVKLTGTGNASNSQVNFVGANGIGITSNATTVIVTANTVDVDLATVANTSSANLVLSGGGESETVKLSGNNGLVVAATNTTNIVVENKGSQHTVTVNGSSKYVIDGTAQQDLRLVPGVIYWFDQSDNSNDGHPLAFGTAANGSEVSQGTASGFTIYEQVGTPGNAGAYTRVQLQQDAPNHLYYFCESHSGMGASVYVQPDNLYSNATHVVATDSVSVTGGLTVSAGIVGSGNVSVGDTLSVTNDADISGEVNAASAAIVGAATVGSTLGVTSTLTAGADVDITGEVNAASAAIVGNASVGGNLTVTGNFTVSGSTTEVSSTTVVIDDPMLSLADNQADTTTFTDAVDVGFYGVAGNTSSKFFYGIARDQSANTFIVYNGVDNEPGTTVDLTGGGIAQLDAIIDGGTYS